MQPLIDWIAKSPRHSAQIYNQMGYVMVMMRYRRQADDHVQGYEFAVDLDNPEWEAHFAARVDERAHYWRENP